MPADVQATGRAASLSHDREHLTLAHGPRVLTALIIQANLVAGRFHRHRGFVGDLQSPDSNGQGKGGDITICLFNTSLDVATAQSLYDAYCIKVTPLQLVAAIQLIIRTGVIVLGICFSLGKPLPSLGHFNEKALMAASTVVRASCRHRTAYRWQSFAIDIFHPHERNRF